MAKALMRYDDTYDFNNPLNVNVSVSLRMVADLGDDDKFLAVLPGGVAGRVFRPHYKAQIKAFVDGKRVYWWFSDRAINTHRKMTLVLSPE
jgi:penicillin amidase